MVCILYNISNDINNHNSAPEYKTIRAGWFEDAINWIEDLFDGDGNVNGTPGDPYTIKLV